MQCMQRYSTIFGAPPHEEQGTGFSGPASRLKQAFAMSSTCALNSLIFVDILCENYVSDCTIKNPDGRTMFLLAFFTSLFAPSASTALPASDPAPDDPSIASDPPTSSPRISSPSFDCARIVAASSSSALALLAVGGSRAVDVTHTDTSAGRGTGFAAVQAAATACKLVYVLLVCALGPRTHARATANPLPVLWA